MKYLQDFDLCIESHHNIIVDDVSTFFRKLQLADENIVLFKSMESLGTTNHVNFKSVLIKSIVNKVMLQPNLSGNEYTQKFIEACTVSSETLNKTERATVEQSENQLWFDLRLGRITASRHHEILTKTSTLLKLTNSRKQKTTTLVSKIIYSEEPISNAPLIWGQDNEDKAFKTFFLKKNLFIYSCYTRQISFMQMLQKIID